MAQSYQTDDEKAEPGPDEKRPSGFHYYSGGEIKELEHTNVSPLLWAGWSVVIIGAIGYLLFGGALGPHVGGGFKPTNGSQAQIAKIQGELDQGANGTETAQMADMRQLVPHIQASQPGVTDGESLDTSIQHGSNIYQSYCIGCHGPNQDGNGVNASSLNPKPRNLHDGPFMRETLDYNRINHSLHYGVHGTAMPRWENTLSEREIQEVVSYVLSLTWTMPAQGTDTTTSQLNGPMPAAGGAANTGAANDAASGADATPGVPAPGKSASGSSTNTPGGSYVQGGSVSNSPAPITPMVEGNPAAATSTAPPSQSGQAAPVSPDSVRSTAPDNSMGGPQVPPASAPAPGGMTTR